MNAYKLTYLGVKIISIICFIASLKALAAVTLSFTARLIYLDEYNTRLLFVYIAACIPSLVFTLISIILWLSAKKLADVLVRNPDSEIELNVQEIFKIGIALLGMYLITFDISAILYNIVGYFGIYTGFDDLRDDGTPLKQLRTRLSTA